MSKKFDNIRLKLEQSTNDQESFITTYLLNDFNKNDFIFSSYELSPTKSNDSPKSSRKFKSDDEILFNLNLETYDLLNR